MKTAYEERFDKLAIRTGKFFDGEEHLDVASVCAFMICFALARYDAEEREKRLQTLIKFIREEWRHIHLESLQ
jgi:hypothetical protein